MSAKRASGRKGGGAKGQARGQSKARSGASRAGGNGRAAPARAKAKERRPLYYILIAGCWLFLAATAVVAYYAARLPGITNWAVPDRPPNIKVVAADGELIANRGDTGGENLKLSEMPAYLPQAVIAIEDRRYYSHPAIDPIGLGRALVTNIRRGGVVQGGSTLTQQLAKNLFLTAERTAGRKIQEVILAFWLEANYSKKQILEMYLNRVYLGAGAYGVDAAARRYFGKSARNVSIAEAAMLAGLLKAPSRYSPASNPGAAAERAETVLTAMREEGYIDDKEMARAIAMPMRPVKDVAGGSGRYVADWVMNLLPRLVRSVSEDLVVETTIDLKLQAAAADALEAGLAREGATYAVSQGAIVALDQTGAVKALVGGRDYAASQYNRAVDARRQPGSAFKPFVFLAAVENGLSPESVRVDGPVSIRGWQPRDYAATYMGAVSLKTAMAQSLNSVAAQLTAEVGPARVVATAHRLGMTANLAPNPSIALGTSEVSLLDLAGAYVPFANGGQGVIPHVVKRIRTASGKLLYERRGSGPGTVVRQPYLSMMNAMLEETVASGTGRKASLRGLKVGGKTGTSQDYRDAWFVGYALGQPVPGVPAGGLVTGVWFGNDDGTPTKKASGATLPSTTFARFVGKVFGAEPGPAGGFSLPGLPSFDDEPFGAEAPAARTAPTLVGGRVPPAAVGGGRGAPAEKNFLERLFGG